MCIDMSMKPVRLSYALRTGIGLRDALVNGVVVYLLDPAHVLTGGFTRHLRTTNTLQEAVQKAGKGRFPGDIYIQKEAGQYVTRGREACGIVKTPAGKGFVFVNSHAFAVSEVSNNSLTQNEKHE